VVNHDDALAQRGDIGHVVAGEQDGRAGAPVVLAQERPDARLGRDVEADGRLVEEQHLRSVEQPRGELALHTLAERQVADRLLHDRRQFQELIQLGQRALEVGVAEPVDGLVEQERIRRGDVP